MGVVEQALVALLLFGLSGAVYLLVLTARDHAEKSGVATLGDPGLQGGSGVFLDEFTVSRYTNRW